MQTKPNPNSDFSFLDEDEQDQLFKSKKQTEESINLMETQKQILREIINLGSWENQKD